ncbi:MAG: hypothetical protein M3364_07270 [Actinomycetota bacterium]|nr:hypothetical protein [Actinomycetota bacterium]
MVAGLRALVGNGQIVREESHLDDMRAALRGDFERLEERRGEQVLLKPREQPEQPERPEVGTSGAEPSSDESETAAFRQTDATVEREPTKRSWIDRLLGL